MVIGIILTLMLFAWFLVCYILLENRDELCKEKKQIKKKEKSKKENINENIYTTIPDIVDDLEKIIGGTILCQTDGNGLVHINTLYNTVFRLGKETIFRENDIISFIRFLGDLLQNRRDNEELANTRHLKLIINEIENTVANKGHAIQEIEMERELLFAFREKHQINDYIDPLGKAIVLTELKKDNSAYKINYKDTRIDEAVTGN